MAREPPDRFPLHKVSWSLLSHLIRGGGFASTGTLPHAGSSARWCPGFCRAPSLLTLQGCPKKDSPLPVTGGWINCSLHTETETHGCVLGFQAHPFSSHPTGSSLQGPWLCQASLLTFLRAWFPHSTTCCCLYPGNGLLLRN